MTIPDTLAERGSRYGAFLPNAQVSDALNQVVTADAGYQRLAADQREALRQIFLKVSRIVTGDPNYDDNWRDIAGYAQLVLNRLSPTTDPGPAKTDPGTGTEVFLYEKEMSASTFADILTRNGATAESYSPGTLTSTVIISSGKGSKLFAYPGDRVSHTAPLDGSDPGTWSVSRSPEPEPAPEPAPQQKKTPLVGVGEGPEEVVTWLKNNGITRVMTDAARLPAPTPPPPLQPEPRLTFTFTDTDTAENVANWINDHGGQAEPDPWYPDSAVFVTTKPGHRVRFSRGRGQTIRRTRKGNWKIT